MIDDLDFIIGEVIDDLPKPRFVCEVFNLFNFNIGKAVYNYFTFTSGKLSTIWILPKSLHLSGRSLACAFEHNVKVEDKYESGSSERDGVSENGTVKKIKQTEEQNQDF